MDPESGSTQTPAPPPDDRPKLERKWEFEDPAVLETRLLTRQIISWIAVVAVMVTLGGIWVRSSAEERARNRAYRATVKADVTRLVAVQQAYFDSNGRFASLDDLGIDYISSQGVRVRVDRANSASWSGRAWHIQISYGCTISVDTPSNPDQAPPEPRCR